MLVTIFTFVAILAILILVHEFGHFIVAKRSGARVEEFGIGFPPRAFGMKKGETIYSINWLPIGGFVKVFGEDGEDRSNPRSFSAKSIQTRALVVSAGVLMNLLLAAIILSIGHMIGLPQIIADESRAAQAKNIAVRVSEIASDSPASAAGIQAGDTVIELSSLDEATPSVTSAKTIQDFTDRHLGKTVTVSLKRGGEVVSREVIPRASPPEGEGPIGFAMIVTGQVPYPVYLAPIKGIESTAEITWTTLRAFAEVFGDLIRSGRVSGDLAGPIGIAVITGQVQQMGFIFLLQFIALISINLAIINILPFPALDGGRLLFLALEKIRGVPLRQKYEKMVHTIGFALLIFLMILVTFRDIGRFL